VRNELVKGLEGDVVGNFQPPVDGHNAVMFHATVEANGDAIVTRESCTASRTLIANGG
jgi:hypothetical protein